MESAMLWIMLVAMSSVALSRMRLLAMYWIALFYVADGPLQPAQFPADSLDPPRNRVEGDPYVELSALQGADFFVNSLHPIENPIVLTLAGSVTFRHGALVFFFLYTALSLVFLFFLSLVSGATVFYF